MSTFFLFLLLGLGAGSVYALLALGLVLKYRSTGVIDFAHGAVAMFSAYVFVNLRSTGVLQLPWILLPSEIRLAPEGMEVLPALVISLIFGTTLGLVLFFLVYRPLLRAAPLTKVCASVGVMLLLQAVAVIKFGTVSQASPPIFPNQPIRIAGIAFPADRLFLGGLVVVVALVLYFVYRYTRFGLATRAAAENETGASLIGISPVGIAARNWAIASLLAAASGILITPIATLAPASYTLFVVPALCAALIGRFQSFGIVAAAGLGLGIVQSEVIYVQSLVEWLPREGLSDGVPFIIILIAMTISATRLGARGGAAQARNPSLGRPSRPVLTSILTFAIGLVILVSLQGSLRVAFMSSIVTICILLSLVLLSGYTGQVSLAQMSFVGVGAFILSHIGASAGIPFPISLLLAALAVVPLGILLGLPALRVRGVSLAVVTLAAAAAMDALVFNNVPFTGGLGGRTVEPPALFGINLGIADGADYPRIVFGVLLLVIVVLVGYSVARLRMSSTGRMLVAIRSNERAAPYVGINVAPVKLYAFALSAFIAGIGGGLLAYQQGTVSSATFGLFSSLGILAIAYVAGIGRIAGAVIAGLMFSADGLFVSFLDRWLNIGEYQLIVAGLALAITAVANPDGVASEVANEKKGPGKFVIDLRDRIFAVRGRSTAAATSTSAKQTADYSA